MRPRNRTQIKPQMVLVCATEFRANFRPSDVPDEMCPKIKDERTFVSFTSLLLMTNSLIRRFCYQQRSKSLITT